MLGFRNRAWYKLSRWNVETASARNFDEVEIEVDLLDNLACRMRQYPFQRLKMLEHLKTIILMFIPRAYNPRYPLTLLKLFNLPGPVSHRCSTVCGGNWSRPSFSNMSHLRRLVSRKHHDDRGRGHIVSSSFRSFLRSPQLRWSMKSKVFPNSRSFLNPTQRVAHPIAVLLQLDVTGR